MTLMGLDNMPQVVTAIGGLGTASFALVDATKPLPFLGGGVNNLGFKWIVKAATPLMPDTGSSNAMPQRQMLATLKMNWFNGTDLASQKSIAKSLIKLNLNPTNATALAQATGVDPEVLTAVATSIKTGTALTAIQSDVFARFDLILTALLDEAYSHADQVYRNGTRVVAMIFAILLALAAVVTISHPFKASDIAEALLVGILATPLAPIAKDISTALATAVNALQLVKKL